jgi:hypothetical protein
MPMARACSPDSGKVWLMIAKVPGNSNTAPMPWTTREPISTPVVGATATPEVVDAHHQQYQPA